VVPAVRARAALDKADLAQADPGKAALAQAARALAQAALAQVALAQVARGKAAPGPAASAAPGRVRSGLAAAVSWAADRQCRRGPERPAPVVPAVAPAGPAR
jgi:hypothetical protein